MSDPTTTNASNGPDVTSDKSEDEQITELLTAAGETGEPEELDVTPEEEPAAVEDEQEEDDKSEPEEPTQEAEAEGEEAASWGEALGIPDDQIVLDDNGNFAGVKTKVEGEVQQVDLKELVKGYQIETYNTKRSQAIAEERKQFEQFAQQQAQQLTERVTQAAGLVDTLKQQLVGEFEGIDWEQLRMSDPAEYAARRQDYAVRYNQVQQVAQGVLQEQTQLQEQQKQQKQQQLMQNLQKEAQAALAVKPEWSDPEVRAKAMNDMSSFIQEKYGYSPEEVAGITDHRVIGLIEDAMAYRAIKTTGKPKLKKPVPKFQKPGSTTKPAGKKVQLDKLYKKAAASNNRDLKDDAITQLLLNS